MNLYENPLYREDVRLVASLSLPWEKLHNTTLLVSGISGLIGSFLWDVLAQKNREEGLNCTVYGLCRHLREAEERFGGSPGRDFLHLLPLDVCEPLMGIEGRVDYVLHLASNTHPLQYATDPIGTITTNFLGLKNLLDFAVTHGAARFLFASSNEIYGQNRGDTEAFDEDYCGYINPNTLRAGYPESKRCGEALCQAYAAQKGLDFVISRFTRTYGPTMRLSDSKALSQFIRKGIHGEDIVLKSDGMQYYSYTYAADAVSGLLTVLLRGKAGEAYNIAHTGGDIRLREAAALVAKCSGRKVVFESPDALEAAGYSTATLARLDGTKLQQLGWNPHYSIQAGISRTLSILSAVYPTP